MIEVSPEFVAQGLERHIGSIIYVTIDDRYDTYHDDDTDHFHTEPYEAKGKLLRVYEDGIVLGECNQQGFSRQQRTNSPNCSDQCKAGESYFPFDFYEKTHLSSTSTRITRLELCVDEATLRLRAKLLDILAKERGRSIMHEFAKCGLTKAQE